MRLPGRRLVIGHPALAGVLVLWLLAAPGGTLAQRAAPMPRIAMVFPGAPDCPLTPPRVAFLQALGELGFVPRTSLAIDWHCYTSIGEVPGLITEALRLKPDVIVTADTQAAVAAKRLTTTTPIVLTQSSDPVQAGLIASFARPGGNVTGVANLGRELAEKRLALLKEAAPRASRVAVLWNLTNDVHKRMWKSEFEAAARQLGMTLLSAGVNSPDEIERAFSAFKERRVEAVLVMPDGLLYSQRALIAMLTMQHRVPAVHTFRQEAEAGALLTYGPNVVEMSRQGAVYVAKILKGATPADLPVEQPRSFELIINLKTAKALRLTIPSSLLLRADEVIQ